MADNNLSQNGVKSPQAPAPGISAVAIPEGSAIPPPGQTASNALGKPSTTSQANNNIVGVHYKIGRKIGEGSFGIIYEGVNLLNNQPIAIKFEPRKSDAPQLRDEYRTYKIMAQTVGVPSVYYFGQEGLHNILCIDLLGPSLEDMFDLCSRKFSIKTTCMAAKQMITRVQAIHERNLIYRDIKPDNFLVGRIPRTSESSSGIILKDPNSILANHSLAVPHPASQVYIVDFGMAKQYRDPKTKVHIPYREKKSLSGTARYMSINTHLGREQSRRDDLEALGHVFMYFLRGSLPWQGLKAATNKAKYEKIGEKKQLTSVLELCENIPEEFGQYLNYARELKFEEQPDYDHLRELMNKVLKKIGEVDDGVFDWMIVLDQKRKQKEALRESRANSQQISQSQVALGTPTGQDQSPTKTSISVQGARMSNFAIASPVGEIRPSEIVSPNQSTQQSPIVQSNERPVESRNSKLQLPIVEEQAAPPPPKKKFNLFSCCMKTKD